jgi:phosphoglycolate phosphatase
MTHTDNVINLIIFDLDGTLIDVFEFHIASIEKVVMDVWEVPDLLPKQERYGIPQKETLRRIPEASGIEPVEIDRKLSTAMTMLTSEMQRTLPDDLTAKALPGALELLNALNARSDVYLVLATGTLGPTADILLERSSIKQFFPVGAYGHECNSREELVQLALRRGIEHYQLDPDQIRVTTIGDAPSDIKAGKSIGAYTISVATSSFTVGDLGKFEPDVLLENLVDPDGVISKLMPTS